MAKAEYRSAVRSRRLINEALAELIKEKPVDKITVTDIVKRADINRGTFYAHYADVPDVLEHQVEDACQMLRQALDEHQAHTPSDTSVVLRQIQKALEGDLSFFTALLASSLSPRVSQRLRDVFVDYMTEHAPADRKQDEQFQFMLRFVAGGVSTMYCDWASGKLSQPLSKLTDQMIRITKKLTA